MALNQERIGHRYPSYRYEVSREKIREYAAATGASLPDDADVASDLVAPPTFAACITARGGSQWASDPELGFHPMLVHGSQTYEFHRPVKVGAVLECTPSIEDIRTRGRNEHLTARIDCVDAATGDDVLTGRALIVFLGSAAAAEAG